MRFWLLPILVARLACAQELPLRWEELTATDFVKAIEKAKGVCLLPFGILEKHGPAGVLGTDLINVRYQSIEAAKQEYVVVFPEYYFGQIFEAKHQPGTIAYSTNLQLQLLTETTAEMGRNGCKKIVIVNGHGGNTALLQYFGQIQLETAKDYVIYSLLNQPAGPAPPAAAPSKPGVDGHAGESEISNLMVSRPDLAHPERSATDSGTDRNRLDLPTGLYTGIWWYSKFPNHYAGDSAAASLARGHAMTKMRVDSIVAAIRAIKADQMGPRLQKEFFDRATNPMR